MMERVLVLQAGRSRAVRGDDPVHPARSPRTQAGPPPDLGGGAHSSR